jgi:hypothetical protein
MIIAKCPSQSQRPEQDLQIVCQCGMLSSGARYAGIVDAALPPSLLSLYVEAYHVLLESERHIAGEIGKRQ